MKKTIFMKFFCLSMLVMLTLAFNANSAPPDVKKSTAIEKAAIYHDAGAYIDAWNVTIPAINDVPSFYVFKKTILPTPPDLAVTTNCTNLAILNLDNDAGNTVQMAVNLKKEKNTSDAVNKTQKQEDMQTGNKEVTMINMSAATDNYLDKPVPTEVAKG